MLTGTPEKIRTPDLLVRSQTLYPAELPAQVLCMRFRPITEILTRQQNKCKQKS